MLFRGQADENGILFVCFPITAIAAALSRSPMTVKRALSELETALNDEKALQHQLKKLTRSERTHRLCTRDGMLETFLQEPERLADDDVMALLKVIFRKPDVQEMLKKLLEREKPETP